MYSINKISIAAIGAMVLFSFTNIFGVSVAGVSVLIGAAFFFINKAVEKQPFAGSGLDMKSIGRNLNEKAIWVWIALPVVMDAVSIMLSKLFLPEYIEHIYARSESIVSYGNVVFAVLQLAFLALGEEIAWRAFFQKQLSRVLPIAPVLIISSVLFAIGHLATGNPLIVIYDIFFVFINSVLYGIVFHKTNNAWVSAISHFIANFFSIIILGFI